MPHIVQNVVSGIIYMLMVLSVPANVQLATTMTQSWLLTTIIVQYANLDAVLVLVQLLATVKLVQT